MGKESKEREVEENKGRKNLPVPERGIEPTTLTRLQSYSNIYTTQDPWLQLLYEYHEGYILNSIAISNAHEGERERKCHRAEL